MNSKTDFWKSNLKEWAALDPIDRISEVIFGLIMVLAVTGTISAATVGKREVEDLLWAALGCNFAWGLVDSITNLLGVFIDRQHVITQMELLKRTEDPGASREIVRTNLSSPLFSILMDDASIDRLAGQLKKLPEPNRKDVLTGKDFLIAGQVFLLVVLSTFPVAIPFFLCDDVVEAMRISNGIALVSLFAGGYSLARYAGLRPVITALIFTSVGLLLVSLTIAFGG